MPRIPPSLVSKAHAINPLLARLLPVCRDLRSAQAELRWLDEHARKRRRSTYRSSYEVLHHYVRRRGRGEPLQYILGSEYFGELEIRCRPGVLIPRQETAASVGYLVKRLLENDGSLPRRLRVLDLCTGSGCIPLLFHHDYYTQNSNSSLLEIAGVDVSSIALGLARQNKTLQLSRQARYGGDLDRLRSLRDMQLLHADVLRENHLLDVQQAPSLMDVLREAGLFGAEPKIDILISNPPYISTSSFRHATSPSVRKFEPRLALVPPSTTVAAQELKDGDVFYPRLLQVAKILHAKVALFEVADLQQAQRVAAMAVEQRIWDGIEIWRDSPSTQLGDVEVLPLDTTEVRVIGEGRGRSVVAYKGNGASWLR